jgi:glutaredoxin
MEFDTPAPDGFTIYSKSGCLMCTKVKDLLKSKSMAYVIIDCDEYLIEERDNFLLFMKELANQEIKVFPIVYHNGAFVGSYKETLTLVETLNTKLDFNDLDF